MIGLQIVALIFGLFTSMILVLASLQNNKVESFFTGLGSFFLFIFLLLQMGEKL